MALISTAITQSASDITPNAATINGKISDDGGGNCEAKFRWAEVLKRDNFEWGNDGDDIDTSGGGIVWTKSVTGTSTAKISTDQFVSGIRSLELYRDGTHSPGAQFPYTAGTGYDISFWIRKGDTANLWIVHGNGVKRIFITPSADEHIYYMNAAGTLIDTGYCVTVDTWQLFEVKNIDWTAGTYDLYFGGTLIANAQMNTSSSQANIVLFYNNGGTSYVYIDDVEVIKDWTVTDWDNNGGSYYHTNDTFSYNLTSLLSATQYEYQVQAKNEAGEGVWSSSAYFMTTTPFQPWVMIL